MVSEIIASAPAKLILCGEHAVVYRRPAIALPLSGIRARVRLVPARAGGVIVQARDLRRRWNIADDPGSPLSELIAGALEQLAPPGARTPDLRISIRSAIPIASGMGSGAAVATALVRALAAYLGRPLSAAAVSELVYASERRFHGTPSGIDNTVIAYEQPVWFVRSAPDGQAGNVPAAPLIEPIAIARPLALLIGDTGLRSATRAPVGEVRQRWQASPAQYEALFDQIGELVLAARGCLAEGRVAALGPLLTANHALLQQIGVSSPELDALVQAALGAGALGAKLSGAGWGGVMLALVEPARQAAVAHALEAAGARRVFATTVQAHTPA